MALFGKKKNREEVKEQKVAPISAEVAKISRSSSRKHTGSILLSPRITEKSSLLGQHNVYVFNVSRGANKREVADAVRTIYSVTPVAVRVIQVPGKTTRSRTTNRVGRSASGKKAYVYLKKGETLELV